MTTEVSDIPLDTTASVIGGAEDAKLGQNVPVKKRKKADDADGDAGTEFEAKRVKEEDQVGEDDEDDDMKPLKRAPMSKAREIRLEQNRKAARESRRRKKVMIEELQRSVIFFSRANGTLKQQNDELSRMLMQAQAQISAVESGQQAAQSQEAQQAAQQAAQPAQPDQAQNAQPQAMPFQNVNQQAQAQAVATQAMYESQGFPPAAARAAAQTMNASTPAATPTAPAQTPAAGNPSLPAMQPGATMQAMANFQQAAAAAMQAAMGMNPAAAAAAASAASTPGAPPPQAYTETLNALAMQQAAAVGGAQYAVLGVPQMQQNVQATPFMAHPMMAWQQGGAAQQAPVAAPQAAPPQQQPAQEAAS